MKNVFLIMCVYLLGIGWLNAVKAAEEGLVLEGVGIIGEHRYAFVNYKKQSFKVVPQETVDDWLIEKIEPRAIFVRSLKTEKGKEGKKNELLEINMDSVSVEPLPTTPKTPTNNPFQANKTSNESLKSPVAAKPKPAFKPRVIKDEDIPPGHRRVRTPFGDVLVKDDGKTKK